MAACSTCASPVKLQLTADSTPMIEGSTVYVSLFPYHTYALDWATGAQRWRTEVCCPANGSR